MAETSKPTEDGQFDARLDLVPLSPGVYLMKDSTGSVIYVGKARQLRQRLRSYFGGSGSRTDMKVRAMLSHVADFSYILTQNELEAFVLEANLIKSYRPFYNILLKDDRDYPYLRVTWHEAYPRILKAYRIGSDQKLGAKYYGPFLAGDLYHALTTIHELFPLKTCRRLFPRDIGKERPCLNYYIHKCIGPCRGDISEDDYRAVMRQVVDFLEGRYSAILESLQAKMQAAAADLRFEEAGEWRDKLRRLEKLLENQVAVTHYGEETDILGLARGGGLSVLVRLELRRGKITATTTHFLSENGETEQELLLAFITQYYAADARPLPRHFLLPPVFSASELAAAEAGLRAAFLDQGLGTEQEPMGGRKLLHLNSARRGAKSQLLDMAASTAQAALRRKNLLEGRQDQARAEALALLGRLCGTGLPRRIEAFDVANYGTEDKACSMIVFVDGKAERKSYRLFKIKRVEGQDDYASMREALERRLTHLDDPAFGGRPDLCLLDGGLQHVGVGLAVLEAAGLAGANAGAEPPMGLAGIVKDRKHRTRGLALANGSVIELAQLARGSAAETKAGSGAGVEADAGLAPLAGQLALQPSEAQAVLRLLSRIQDEAHRVAGNYMKKLSQKRQLHYSLESIPGVGQVRRRALLEAFRSVAAIAEASVEELMEKTKGLGRQTAEEIYAYFHQEEEAEQ